MMPLYDEPLTETVRPAGIRCGRCKNTHPTVADVRACFGNTRIDAATDGQRSYAQGLLRERIPTADYADLTEDRINAFSKEEASRFLTAMREQPVRPKADKGVAKMLDGEFADIPEGYYAVRAKDDTIDFFKIVDGRHNRLLFQVFGSPGSLSQNQIKRTELARSVLKAINEDHVGSMKLFGLELAICGACGSPLTNEVSRATGIGPVCARKKGW